MRNFSFIKKFSCGMLLIFSIVIFEHAFGGTGKVLLEAKVDKNKIKIGDLVTYSIIVSYDETIEVQMPELGANLGAFEIRDFADMEPEKHDGNVIQRREYVVSTFDIGDYDIPPVTVRYTTMGDSLWKDLTTDSLKITVESMKPSEEGDIRDIKPPLEIPRDWWRITRFVIAGVLAVLVGILILYYFKRRKEGKSLLPRREKLKLPPHEIALAALEKLLTEELWQKGDVKQFYIRLSEIIRHYVEDRFFIIAIEMTTFQLIEAMKQAEIESDVTEIVEIFLMQCDLVKFAKYVPTKKEHNETTDLAFSIIEKTKIVFEPEDVNEEFAQSADEEKAKVDQENVSIVESPKLEAEAEREVENK